MYGAERKKRPVQYLNIIIQIWIDFATLSKLELSDASQHRLILYQNYC